MEAQPEPSTQGGGVRDAQPNNDSASCSKKIPFPWMGESESEGQSKLRFAKNLRTLICHPEPAACPERRQREQREPCRARRSFSGASTGGGGVRDARPDKESASCVRKRDLREAIRIGSLIQRFPGGAARRSDLSRARKSASCCKDPSPMDGRGPG